MAHGGNVIRLTLIDQYLELQREPTAVERFAREHDRKPEMEGLYRELIPLTKPRPGEQFAFQVDLDRCTSCKACVTACHSMNGLDEHETWRFVGHLHGGTPQAPVQQAVTTACHHCIDPACLSGCPVQAYEKDPVTGIVKHLDDQCIGCQYCTLTCPYEVPQYSQAKGIVRKCDMCSDRLAAGEAPACVQACPNEAISIRIVSQAAIREEAVGGSLMPAAPSSGITKPTTTFRTDRAMPSNTLPVDYHTVRPAHRHLPLVIMLVLMQLSVGAFAAEQLLQPFMHASAAASSPPLALLALLFGFAGLGASIFHLGRPLYAFRAILGLKTSWMSREVLVFGVFAKLAIAYTALVWRAPLLAALDIPEPAPALLRQLETLAGFGVVLVGLAGTFCSVMIYHVTRRQFWNGRETAAKFFGTAWVLGAATALVVVIGAGAVEFQDALAFALLAGTSAKLVSELSILRYLTSDQHPDLKRSAVLLTTDLRNTFRARLLLAAFGGVVMPAAVLFAGSASPLLTIGAGAGLLALIAGELLERTMFFSAVSAPRMPGRLS